MTMNKKILLLAEDDFFLRSLMCKKLQLEGYVVIEAENGKIALEKMNDNKIDGNNKIDLLLLDLVMPEVDGFDVLEAMTKDPNLSKIPIIILSNLGQKEKIDKAMSLGAKDFVIKAHFTPGEIVEKIKNQLKLN